MDAIICSVVVKGSSADYTPIHVNNKTIRNVI